MEFGSIKNQVDPHCVFTRSETGPELRVAVLVAVKIEESTKTELLSISGPLIVSVVDTHLTIMMSSPASLPLSCFPISPLFPFLSLICFPFRRNKSSWLFLGQAHCLCLIHLLPTHFSYQPRNNTSIFALRYDGSFAFDSPLSNLCPDDLPTPDEPCAGSAQRS